MKRNYERPTLELELWTNEDVIRTSGLFEGDIVDDMYWEGWVE